ncbi:uncharacterized protein YALI1_A13227g [Yarrowia lipolytica]|uniref:Secreted protein n=1 Tax=Yarrowia lipolytica TaxID=4952 RepID=A0A1D8N4Q7_YARLL|nr:hypothetical protein YALI1_A13227g [Yarrowia lipolytica]
MLITIEFLVFLLTGPKVLFFCASITLSMELDSATCPCQNTCDEGGSSWASPSNTSLFCGSLSCMVANSLAVAQFPGWWLTCMAAHFPMVAQKCVLAGCRCKSQTLDVSCNRTKEHSRIYILYQIRGQS